MEWSITPRGEPYPMKINRILAISLAAAIAATGTLAVAAPVVRAAGDAQATSVAKEILLRKLGEWIGMPVRWDSKERTIEVDKGTETIRYRLTDEGISSREGTVYITQEALRRTLGIAASWSPDGKPALEAADAVTRANAFLTRLQSGDMESAYSFADADFRESKIPAWMLQWIGQLAAFPRTWGTVASDAVHTTVTVSFQGPAMPFDVEIRLNGDGQVDDLYATVRVDGYRSPAYDRPEAYKEQPLVVGEGDHAVQGTLTLPAGEGPFPAVVLVQGDGELDADSTVYAQKPFRDLAVGLAGQGIAVLRLPKTTREHFVQLSDRYTIDDEFADNALLAAELLARNPAIDPKRVYAAGHSRGGWMIPRILADDSEKRFAGAIVLAGADPRYSEIESYDHPELGGMVTPEELSFYREQLKLVKEPGFDPANPPQAFQLPPNAYWWADIAGYEPAEEAKKRDVDMLVLQGEEDFQVPAVSLQGWKEVYAGRANVEYRSYPKLTHLFTEGTLEDGVQNYLRPANVDAQVVDDIASWIGERAR